MSNPYDETRSYPSTPEETDFRDDDTRGVKTQRFTPETEPAGGRYAGAAPTEPAAPVATPTWKRGTSWATVAWGLVCMFVAGLVLTFQLTDIEVDWAVAGPATVVGLGLVLVLVGLLGLLNRDRDEE